MFQMSLFLTSVFYLRANHSEPVNMTYNSTPLATGSSSGVLFPVLVFVCVLVIIIHSYIHEKCCQSGAQKNDGPQVLRMFIVCESGQYEYKLILRVGCPTANFDMQHAYIDVSVLGKDDVVQGHPVRFKCSLLPNRVCGEMHLEVSLHSFELIF